MTLDHVGYMFFPESIMFRLLGRLAFPIFAYCIYEGYQKTSNFNKYIKRLIVMAFISQIPFSLVTQSSQLNIFFTLLIGLSLIEISDTEGFYGLLPSVVLLVALLNFVPSFDIDYSWFGVILPVVFFLNKNSSLKQFLFVSILVGVYLYQTLGMTTSMGLFYLFTIIGVAISVFRHKLIEIKYDKNNLIMSVIRNKKMYYYYPIHLMLIWIVSLFSI